MYKAWPGRYLSIKWVMSLERKEQGGDWYELKLERWFAVRPRCRQATLNRRCNKPLCDLEKALQLQCRK